MSPFIRRCSTLLVATLASYACGIAPIAPDDLKVIRGQALAPFAIHEECLRLEPGDRTDFTFESSEPVDFNVHYHEGKTIVMPLVREKTRGDAAVFAPALAQDYCLMWEAGPAGALIDYRVRLKRAGS